MKKIFTIVMLAMSILSASAGNLVCQGIEKRASNNNCSYSGVLSWTAMNANTMEMFSFEAGTLAKYTTLKINFSNFVDLAGDAEGKELFRVLYIKADGTNISHGMYSAGDKSLNILDKVKAEEINDIVSIAVGGSCTSGQVNVNYADVKLVGNGAELVCDGFKARPSNNKVKYDMRFAWTASNANTMSLFKFDAGTLSHYASLDFKCSDLQTSADGGLSYRILYIADGKTVYTKSFASAGSKSHVLSENLTNEQIATITEIAIGGISDNGSIAIMAEDIVLIDNTTGIADLTVSPDHNFKNHTYNLAGQRVSSNVKGIVISNGKKYVVK